MEMSSTSESLRFQEELDLDQVKDHFRQFQGGRVTLTKDEDSGIGFILLDHPEKKNCFSGQMMVDLSDVITELENWKNGKGLILHSNTNVFCSGVFLDMVKQFLHDPSQANMLSYLMQDSARRFRNLPLVSVALVQGKAIAGGSEILLWPDFRLLTKDAEVMYAHAKMGLACAWGGGLILKTVVGRAKALEFTLTSRKVSAEEALSVGLANAIVNVDTRLEEAIAWLSPLISCSAEVVRAQKTLLLGDSFLDERRNFVGLWGKPSQMTAYDRNFRH